MRHYLRRTCAVAACVVCPLASAQTFSPDFNGPTLDPSLSTFGGAGFSSTVSGGVLTVHYSYDGTAGVQSTSGGVAWDMPFAGDYVVKVTENVSGMADLSWPQFMNGGPLLWSGSAGVFVGPSKSGAGASVNGSEFDPGYVGGPSMFLPSQAVDIMFVRTGDTIVESAAVSGTGAYQTLYTATGPEFSGPMTMTWDLYYNGSQAISDATVQYSNVTVAVVPEPPILSMLGIGIACLAGCMNLRRRS